MTESTVLDIPLVADAQHRRHVVGGEPMLFHCHHYNTFLQRSIQDASYIDSAPFLVGAAAEVANAQLRNIFEGIDGADARLAFAEKIYSWAGFGLLDLSGLTADGGTVTAPSSHYGLSWKTKFGPSDGPVDMFTQGWIAGAVAAAFDAPNGSYTAIQTECTSAGAGAGSYNVTASPGSYGVWPGVGVGPLTDHQPREVRPNNVDYEGIYDALVGMPIAGDEQGLIPAFGVYLTHQYANYYNRISFEFERAMSEKFGEDGVAAARPLLVEAGHVCAFNTFGGIMKSAEWDALIKPSLDGKEDWTHGITAAVNALGWGRWQVTDLSEKKATFVVHDDYESVGHLAMYGESDHSVSYLAEGAAAGIMNLVYHGDIASSPDLSPEFYDRMFKSADSYEVTASASRAAGDDVTVIHVVAPD